MAGLSRAGHGMLWGVSRRPAATSTTAGLASLWMAVLAFWFLDRWASGASTRKTFRWWWAETRRSPEGSCLAACGAWFVTMMALFIPVLFLFAALQAEQVDLAWWGWIPSGLLGAALAGSGVNGVRHFFDDDAAPTASADIWIPALVAAFTGGIFLSQLLATTSAAGVGP